MRELKYGGQIVPGDFIVVSDGNHLSFGWYAGNGCGTLQYYPMRGPQSIYNNYKEFLRFTDKEKSENKWICKRFEKGFTINCLSKSFINAVHSTRVMKITNIEDIFTDPEDRKTYEESKQALITLKFIKQ
jgi:hypothetical protein